MEEITWGNTLSVVLTGLVVVFAALVILIFLVWLMGKIFIAIGNKRKQGTGTAKTGCPPSGPAGHG